MQEYKITITFERISDKHVVGYEVFRNDIYENFELGSSQIQQSRVAYIEDNGAPNPVFVSKKLTPREHIGDSYIVYDIPNHKLIMDESHPFNIYQSGIHIPETMYLLNKDTMSVTFLGLSGDTPEFIAEYYIDGYSLELTVNSQQSFTIRPLVDESYTVLGRHSELV